MTYCGVWLHESREKMLQCLIEWVASTVERETGLVLPSWVVLIERWLGAS